MSIQRMSVPRDVAQAVIGRWPEVGPQWCSHVPDELSSLCARYDAVPVSVFRSRYGLAVEVGAKNSLLVMRSSPDPDGPFQAAVSVALSALGVAPMVHEVVETGTGVWTIMDRIDPGTNLYDVPTSLGELAALLRPLSDQAAPVVGMPSLADWLRARLTDDRLIDLPTGRSPAPLGERAHALRLLEDLAADCPASLCHGDPSRGNVLVAAEGRLLLVDPREISGELPYDVAIAALKTAQGEYAPDRATHLAKLVEADPERVQAWLVIASAARV